MDTKGRKLFRYAAGLLMAVLVMTAAYETTAMANSIDLIDTEAIPADAETVQTEEEALLVQTEENVLLAQAEEEALLAQAEEQQNAILESAGITQDELDLLAAIIYCEAGNQPYAGKVAVGNVVLNRVKCSRYPDNITDVIYDSGQFSPVKNGSLSRALKDSKADPTCYQAAMEALAGSEPVGDKLYFRTNNGRSGQVIGDHVFY